MGDRTAIAMYKASDQPKIALNSYKKDIPVNIRTELVSLEAKDNWHNIFYLGFDWLIVIGAIAASVAMAMHPLVCILAIIVIGSRQRALMNLVHEASHNKLFKNRVANDWIGRFLAAYPLGASLSAYKSEHYIHHGFLWNEEKDPKTIRYSEVGLLPPPSDPAKFYMLHVLKPLLLVHALHNIAAALSLKGEHRSETFIRFGFLLLVLAGIIVAHLTVGFFLFWVVPFCTSFQIIRYWNEMAEHAGLQNDDAWMATRNWTSSFLVCWILAPHSDDLYHLTHHLFPLIPHYRLADAHRLLMQVPEYAGAHHCDGFFWPRRSDAPSVIQDVRRPQDIHKFLHR